MLVFILPGTHSQLSESTLSSVQRVFPDARPIVIPSEERAAWVMNEALSVEMFPWFMTLYAGDDVQPHAKIDLERWLRTTSDQLAGFILNPVHTLGQPHVSSSRAASPPRIPRGPLIWRTQAVMNGHQKGFATKDQLPFQKYVLIDKQLQLSGQYEWSEIDCQAILCHHRRAPAWMKEAEEWLAVSPLLLAAAHTHSQRAEAVSPPLVTIALCTYNDSEYLTWAVRSVLVQSCKDWELVILDDGSTSEETEACLQHLPKDSRITIVRQQKNRGKAHALNRILHLSHARWLLELDADDWLAPNALEVLLREAHRVQHADVIYGNHVEWLERANKQLVYQRVHTAPSSLHCDSLRNDAYAIAPRMFNVSSLKQVKGWNEDMLFEGRLYEDIDLLSRLSLHHKLYHVPESIYHRRLRSSSTTHRHPLHYSAWRNSTKDVFNELE
ncbi:hypothetical protein M2277_005558 [Paenibacillus sp. LBL]|uniref:glycosyltransferase family 2 protein n=1 Tax=Paenibacillus sp. LBL TaxID=2940563 RepID=UPI002473CA49|nr:glycosyltransferase family A protein [Paenibacillus sp. LBL]MDH6674859.1 hypothetical protein [Paenibacillus sp. LBL]